MGQPIIAHTIRAAIQTGLFDEVLVSTEDAEIAGFAKRAGASVLLRPSELASDSAGVVDVCIDAIEGLLETPKVFSCLYPTAPLRSASDITQTFSLVDSGATRFAMAVTTFDLPVYQALRVRDDGAAKPLFPDMTALKSQDIPEIVVDNGSSYVADVASFIEARTFYGPGLRVHKMPRWRSIDIDTQEDLELARWYAEKYEGHS